MDEYSECATEEMLINYCLKLDIDFKDVITLISMFSFNKVMNKNMDQHSKLVF